MFRERKGLELTGLILIYIFGTISLTTYVVCMIVYYMWWSIFFIYLFLGITCFASLILTILYHANKLHNYVLIGILGLFSSFFIGGLFVLIGQPKPGEIQSSVNIRNDLSNLEYKLRQLDTLLTKGVITKEEYDRKRQSIIDDY